MLEITPQQLSDNVVQWTHSAPFKFERGGVIEPLVLQYETVGQLNSGRDNVILIHHALSTGAHVCSHAGNPKPGWWEAMVGKGKPIDTERFFIICINNLGSCFGSSGPTSLNSQGQPYGADFPATTIMDMVNAQQLLLSALGIRLLYAVIGNSMGAMLSLQLTIQTPQLVQHLVSVSSCYKAYPVNAALRKLAREIITLDPHWLNGQYQDNRVLEGFKIARKLGHLTYRNKVELNQRFGNEQAIEHYLTYKANQFATTFDANCYLTLTQAMDWFDVTRGAPDLLAAFKKIHAQALVIAVSSDELFPSTQQQALYDCLTQAGVEAKFILNPSYYGHDAFYADVSIANEIQTFLS